MINGIPHFNDVVCKFFLGPKRLELIQQMHTWMAAARAISIYQCERHINAQQASRLIGGFQQREDINSPDHPLGVIPWNISARQLRDGIIALTHDHATRVLELLYSNLEI
jgi:hypothetical protein